MVSRLSLKITSMGPRTPKFWLVFCTAFLTLSFLAVVNRNDENGVYEYTVRLEELNVRLRNTELQSETRKAEVRHLQREIHKMREDVKRQNISGPSLQYDTNHDKLAKLRSQLLQGQNNGNNSMMYILPTILQYMPHLIGKPDSLEPALHLSKGTAQVSIVIGVPTIKRDVESYIMETLSSLVAGLSTEEKLECLIVVFIAEVDLEYVKKEADRIQANFHAELDSGLIEVISPRGSYYPDLNAVRETFGDTQERVKWRTKQNLDFSYLMMYAQSRGKYYVQLEDDLVAQPGYFTTMKTFAMQQQNKNWLLLEFSALGFIGKMFKTSDLNLIVEFFLMFHKDKPIDWLLDHILYVKVCNPEKDPKHCSREKAAYRIRYKPSQFQHIGLHSSLKGKVQKLKDKDFKKGFKRQFAHINPNADVSTTINNYMKFTLLKAYQGEDIFWGTTPSVGDIIKFRFIPPIVIGEYQFVSSNEQNPGDKFYNTTVEVLPSYQRDKKEGILEAENHQDNKFNRTQDGYIQVGKFQDGKAIGTVDADIGEVVELRLRVIEQPKNWVILSNIHIVPATKKR
ncbi:alpha-1,3-mannosyl-glycoprotein 4-beta-N-acetylglucosaminyltransferase B-like [Asterias rubens]|uniref:alpha-1,3-mannosyl-glycoprotein 4-beta-N-acetylglucosaminyltransferase B-like n=1 Tax=Asterias rubens TaxID=7604 RepID=UPI001454EA0A|nr:alpha-1,3-mannosyl-glycoprotein 4-beta-N-acetylglucosaminyltransferase B-like [Asterias rubens]